MAKSTQPDLAFKTPYNAERFSRDREKNSLPSMTIPDQSFTVLELVTRHRQGLPLGAPRVEVYDGGEDPLEGIDFTKLDLAEQQEIREKHAEYLKELGDDYQKRINRNRERIQNQRQKPNEKTPPNASAEGNNTDSKNQD